MGHQNNNLATAEQFITGVAKAGSEQTDPVLAASEIYQAIAPCEPVCVIFYCGVNYPQAALSKELTRYFPDITVIGCTSAGEITPLGYRKHSISAFALSHTQFAVESMLIENLATFNKSESDALVNEMLITYAKKPFPLSPSKSNVLHYLF